MNLFKRLKDDDRDLRKKKGGSHEKQWLLQQLIFSEGDRTLIFYDNPMNIESNNQHLLPAGICTPMPEEDFYSCQMEGQTCQ